MSWKKAALKTGLIRKVSGTAASVPVAKNIAQTKMLVKKDAITIHHS